MIGFNMNIPQVLAELRAYRSELDDAIASLERLARKRGELRGRPRSAASPRRKKAGTHLRWRARG